MTSGLKRLLPDAGFRMIAMGDAALMDDQYGSSKKAYESADPLAAVKWLGSRNGADFQ